MVKKILLLVCAAMLGVGVFAAPAQAHEKRRICGDTFTVGWGMEPPYSGTQNSVQMILADASGKPITNVAAGQIKVEIQTGSVHPLKLVMNPTFDPDTGLGTPGDYRAWFVPTAVGTYSFTFSGTLGKCTISNAKFTSSESTFDDIKDVTTAQFPVIDPPGNLISSKLDNVQSRLAASVLSAKSSADSAKTAGYIAIGLGGLAVILALFGLAKKR
ncbi:MAG: hypothetical protein ACYDCC_09150 [Actinomycetota bacterium]